MAFRLSVEDGPYVQTLEVRAGALTVGRKPEGGLSLSSPGLADRHAVFRQSGDQVEVEDQDTRIGIRLKGERVAWARLGKGDAIYLGWARITILEVADADESTAASESATAVISVAAAVPGATVGPVVAPRAREETPEFVVLSRRTIRVLPWWAISVGLHALLFAALMVFAPEYLHSSPEVDDRKFVVTLRNAPDADLPEAVPVEPTRPGVDIARPDMSVPPDLDPMRAPSRDPKGEKGKAPPHDRDDDLVLDDPAGGSPFAKAGGASAMGVGDGAVKGTAPGTGLGSALDEVFGKDGASRANAAAAGRLTGEPFTRALVDGLRLRTKPENVKVVRGKYDQGELVMEALGLKHGWIAADDIARQTPGSDVRAIFWNCTGEVPPPSALPNIERWVKDGGNLFTSDWGIELVVEKAFPGTIRPLRDGSRTVMTPDETITFELAPGAAKHPLLQGLPPTQETSRWWLEESSIPFVIENTKEVEVLVVSSDLDRRHGSKLVAVTFKHGKGRVVHVLGHMFQKEGNLRGAYAMQRLLLNFLYHAIRGD